MVRQQKFLTKMIEQLSENPQKVRKEINRTIYQDNSSPFGFFLCRESCKTAADHATETNQSNAALVKVSTTFEQSCPQTMIDAMMIDAMLRSYWGILVLARIC